MRVLVNKRQEVEVRELGGCMAPIWKNYFNVCDSLMFVIDTSDKAKLSCAFCLLIDILAHPQLQTVPILLILNKIDSPQKLSHSQLNDYIHLDGIVHHCPQRIEILQTSAKDGTGLERVVDWMKHHCA
ncbi:DgyrCDS5528 [Dimorphilus gyrociliatus]|nr:DgyrCDS5528 [Dimorphilus gyrociliatus]